MTSSIFSKHAITTNILSGVPSFVFPPQGDRITVRRSLNASPAAGIRDGHVACPCKRRDRTQRRVLRKLDRAIRCRSP